MKRPLRWSPLSLPTIRRQYADDLEAFHARAIEAVPKDVAIDQFLADLRGEAAIAAVADLYWVAEPMAQLALDASHDLPEWTISAVMPSRQGLLVWDGDLPPMDWANAPAALMRTSPLGVPTSPDAPVVGVIWTATAVSITMWPITHTRHLRPLAEIPERDIGPYRGLVPLGVKTAPLPVEHAFVDGDYRGPAAGLIAALGATWLLMSQPTVSDLRRERVGRGALHDPPDRSGADVSIVDLRRLAVDRTSETPSDGERIYQHRWLVRGHWRQQAHGPGRSQRKPVWIESHIKGPAGAPLLASERVMVWRR